MPLMDTLKDHIVIIVLGTAVTSFGTGWMAYENVCKAGGGCKVIVVPPKPVDLAAVFNMGRSIANAEAAILTAPKSAQDSLNGAIQNAERAGVVQDSTKAIMYKAAGVAPKPEQLSTIVDLINSDLTTASKSR